MKNPVELLRKLPGVDQILQHAELKSLTSNVSPVTVTQWARVAVDVVRSEIRDGKIDDPTVVEKSVLDRIRDAAHADAGSQQRPVINATGILLHTNLGRAPLASEAIQRMSEAATYANVELNLQTGKRSGRGDRVMRLLADVCGAEAALVVNNCAAATMLALQTLASGRDVIVSRGQLVEIGGGYRLPEVFAASGAKLKEIGTTNRTYVRDYESAIDESTAAIIRVHRSNFHQLGFVTEPSIRELTELRSRCDKDVLVIDDIGSGCISSLSHCGLDEPTISDSMAAGADVALFSGDKLFGGPQAGIIVGRQEIIERMLRSPMMRALRVDKMTLAGIEATAELHLNGQAQKKIPLLRMLSENIETDQAKATELLKHLNLNSESISIVDDVAQVGGGSVPGSEIASRAIAVQCDHPEKFCERLRLQPQPILARIHDGQVLINLRTVQEHQIVAGSRTIQAALSELNTP